MNVWHIKHDKNINHNHYYFWVLIPNVTSNNMAIVATMKQPLQWNVDCICDGSRDLHRDPEDCCFSLSSCELISFDISVWSLWRASWFVYPFCSVEGKLSCNINGWVKCQHNLQPVNHRWWKYITIGQDYVLLGKVVWNSNWKN